MTTNIRGDAKRSLKYLRRVVSEVKSDEASENFE
jgi:hypothetical protein